MSQSVYSCAEYRSASIGEIQHPHANESYSKCNVQFARPDLSFAASTDSMLTFFLFLSPDYISLHENAPAPPKFRRNGRIQEEAVEDRSNLLQNVAIFEQNLTLFGRSKGVGPTFHLNRPRDNSYWNWTSLTPFISFHSSGLCKGGRPTLHSQANRYNIYDSFFSGDLAIPCSKAKLNPRFLQKFDGCKRRNRTPSRHEPQKWGEAGGQTAKNEENMQEVTAPKL